jgi:polyribonucleotide nucleotidyltransferase
MDEEMITKALKIIVGLTEDVEQGAAYMGKVTKIMPAFAIVEVLPGKEGLLHISQISKERIVKIEDVLKVGQEIMVKVTEVDKEQGKFKLTAKDI